MTFIKIKVIVNTLGSDEMWVLEFPWCSSAKLSPETKEKTCNFDIPRSIDSMNLLFICRGHGTCGCLMQKFINSSKFWQSKYKLKNTGEYRFVVPMICFTIVRRSILLLLFVWVQLTVLFSTMLSHKTFSRMLHIHMKKRNKKTNCRLKDWTETKIKVPSKNYTWNLNGSQIVDYIYFSYNLSLNQTRRRLAFNCFVFISYS